MSDWLSMAADYRKRAEVHKPRSNDALTPEIERLREQGLKPRDIAAALGVHIGVVLAVFRTSRAA